MSWMQTYRGKFNLLDPRAEDVSIQDIAELAPNLCRYNGHCDPFYELRSTACMWPTSAARSSLRGLLARRRRGLLRRHHPAHEAGPPGDHRLRHPLRPENKFDFFLQRIDEVVATALEIPWPLPEEVRHADDVLRPRRPATCWGRRPAPGALPPPLPQIVRPWMPEEVHAQFMRIYQETRP